jgi:C2H2-type zinc finger
MKSPVTTESLHMANTLVLLSRSNGGSDRNQRMFECKTCNRQFPSFQALGGHRASHKKPRYTGSEESPAPLEPTKPRIHECLICGLEFPLGQALGGHMRRHRAKGDQGARNLSRQVVPGLNLDLNLAPPEAEEEAEAEGDWQGRIDLELHLDLAVAEKVRFVEWMH